MTAKEMPRPAETEAFSESHANEFLPNDNSETAQTGRAIPRPVGSDSVHAAFITEAAVEAEGPPESGMPAPEGTGTQERRQTSHTDFTSGGDATEQLAAFFDTMFSDGEGYVHTAVGIDPYLDENGRYTHKDFKQLPVNWPEGRDALLNALAGADGAYDVYVAPYLSQTTKREKGSGKRDKAHADYDGHNLDIAEIERLGGFAVESGTPGHAHVYIPLTHAVTPAQHEILCRAIGKHLGDSDAKISDNDLLRPPGTFNYKPTTRGESPAPVRFLIPPTGKRVNPFELADLLGVDITNTSTAQRSGDNGPHEAAGGTGAEPEPFDLDSISEHVKAAVKYVSGDRSADTARVVGACYDAGMSLGQTRSVVATRPDLAVKLAENPKRDDVAICWKKIKASRETAAWADDLASNTFRLADRTDEDQAQEYLIAKRLVQLRIQQEAKRRLAAENSGPTDLPGFTGLDALLAEPRPQIRYRIEQVAPIGARVLLSAQYKAGKSHMGLNLARALVDGTPFLGAFPVITRATKVVVIDDELSQNMMLGWWERQQVNNTDAIVPVSLRGSVGDFNLLDPDIRDKWTQQLKAIGCDYLVLDCLRPILDALGLDENHDAGKFLVAFDTLLKDAGIGDAAVIHHMGHNSERARGDSRLLDWPDVIWKLVRANDDPASNRFFSAYGRDVDIPEGQIGYDADTGHMTFDQGANRRDAKQTQAKAAKIEAARAAVIEFLVRRRRDGEPAPSKNQIEQSKHPILDGFAQKVRRDAFNALIADGTVNVEPDEGGADRLVVANPCRKCLTPVPDGGQKYHSGCDRVDESTPKTLPESDLGKARQDLGNDLFAEPGFSGEEVRQLGNPLGAVPSTEPPNEEEVEPPGRDFGKKDFAETQPSAGWPVCAFCSSGLFAAGSQAAGVCERCRLAAASSQREADAGEETTA
jgi:hypothetical protein